MIEPFPKSVILRHKKENLKKCSLRGLESRNDFIFYTYPKDELPIFSNYFLLTLGAPPLTEHDSKLGLFLLDGTWRYAEKMFHYVQKTQILIPRSLPSHWKTAYPRRQDDCPSPEQGLASIEAIYAAYSILGRDTTGLLDSYHWKEDFIQINP